MCIHFNLRIFLFLISLTPFHLHSSPLCVNKTTQKIFNFSSPRTLRSVVLRNSQSFPLIPLLGHFSLGYHLVCTRPSKPVSTLCHHKPSSPRDSFEAYATTFIRSLYRDRCGGMVRSSIISRTKTGESWNSMRRNARR